MSAVPAYRRFVRCVLLMLAVCGYNSGAFNTGLCAALQDKNVDWGCSCVRLSAQQ